MMAKFTFKEIAPCLLAIFVDILGFGLVAPLLVIFFTTVDGNIFNLTSSTFKYLSLGVTLALYPFFMFFGTAFIGDLSDIIGRKKTLLISMFGMTIGFLMMGLGVYSSSLALFWLGRALSGFVSASQSVALATISDLSTKETKAIHLSYIALIQCLGFVIGPLMGGVLADVQYYVPFIGSGLFAAVAFFWILIAFEETLMIKNEKKISLNRFFKVFVDAYQNKRIRNLSAIFLLMQIGVALFLPVVLILLTTNYQYTAIDLGLFNGYLGIGFALGLLILLPKMLKRYSIEKIVFLSLFSTFILQFLTPLIPKVIFVWLFAFPFAMIIEVAFSGIFTSFSNATDESSQGWVMGISVATMAIAWAVAGLSTQLIPVIGSENLILIGSLLLGGSAMMMKSYCKKYNV
jgi:DHA1 family tetracycline resistance protein-like MFS transporter